jgi:hypothetical protein
VGADRGQAQACSEQTANKILDIRRDLVHASGRRFESMVRTRYTGISNPKAEFEALRPSYKALIQMQSRCRPFGPEYHILSAAAEALRTAAFHFTGDSTFYSLQPPTSGPSRRPPS